VTRAANSRLGRFFGLAIGILLAVTGAGCAVAWKPVIAPIQPPMRDTFSASEIARGAELAALGDCAVCHTKAPSDYSTASLATNPVLHTGISNGCITCHGAPNAAVPIFYNAYTPKDALLSPVHIPTSTTPCEDCHSSSVFTAFSGTTMTSAKHTLMFAFIGKTCDACHNKVTPALSFYGVTNLTTRPSDHNSGSKLSQDCSSCHNTNNWDGGTLTRTPVAKSAAHSAVTTVVVAPIGVAQRSAPTGTAASVQLTRQMSHAGVTSNCSSCHTGVLATGMGPMHIRTTSTCPDCHTTLAWLPARFDHRSTTASCVRCHNGVTAPGMPTQHVVTQADCDSCHGTIAWQPARFSHLDMVATCASCHNGRVATGQQARHPATAADCGSCHNTLTWSVDGPNKVPLRPLIQKHSGSSGR